MVKLCIWSFYAVGHILQLVILSYSEFGHSLQMVIFCINSHSNTLFGHNLHRSYTAIAHTLHWVTLFIWSHTVGIDSRNRGEFWMFLVYSLIKCCIWCLNKKYFPYYIWTWNSRCIPQTLQITIKSYQI